MFEGRQALIYIEPSTHYGQEAVIFKVTDAGVYARFARGKQKTVTFVPMHRVISIDVTYKDLGFE